MNTKINTFIFDCFGVICDPVLNAWYKENMLKRGFVDENLKNVIPQSPAGARPVWLRRLVARVACHESMRKYQKT